MHVLDIEYYRGPVSFTEQLNVTTGMLLSYLVISCHQCFVMCYPPLSALIILSGGLAPSNPPSQLEAHLWDWILFLVAQRATLLLDPEARTIGLLTAVVQGVLLQSVRCLSGTRHLF